MPKPVHSSLDAAFLDPGFLDPGLLDPGFLADLADSLGRAIADNGGGFLVHVVARPDGPDVGILPLDGLAPADVLLGAVAPADWAVLGVATTGWARPLGRRKGRVRAEVVVLVVRDGRVVGHLRKGDQVITEPPECGVTLDFLQRALGLPTPPPAEPAVDWARLRELVVAGGWPALGLSPDEAAWLDDGSFSRWVMASGGVGPTRSVRSAPEAPIPPLETRRAPRHGLDRLGRPAAGVDGALPVE